MLFNKHCPVITEERVRYSERCYFAGQNGLSVHCVGVGDS